MGVRELTLVDLIKLGRRWWWVLLLCPTLAAAVAFLVSSAMTPIYRAEATLLIEQSQVPGTIQYNDILAAERLTRTYSRLVTTRSVLEETIARLNLSLTPEQLQEQIEVTAVRDTQLVKVAVLDPSPERAATVANTLAQVFIEQQQARQRAITGSSREELQRSIDDVRTRIDELSSRIAELEQGPDAGSAEVQAELSSLRGELNQAQTTYSALLEAQQRMALAEAQAGTRVLVAEQAVPPVDFVKPRTLLNTGLAGLLGLALGIGLVLVAGYLDDTVKTSEDVQRLTGKAAIGAIPVFPRGNGLEPVANPHSLVTETYRALRTNLQFATAGRAIRSIAVTSPRPGDGKTTTLTNLGVVLAQAGQRVILVDADLRKPALHRAFGLVNRSGLTNLLLRGGDEDLGGFLRPTPVEGLQVLTTGPLPPNPPDLLGSPRMAELIERLERLADIVLIDTPPLALSDPLIVAGSVDGVLLVTMAARTRSTELIRALEELSRASTPVIGVVLNQVRLEHDSYYAYYYEYYRPEDGAKAGPSEGRPAVPPLLPQESRTARTTE